MSSGHSHHHKLVQQGLAADPEGGRKARPEISAAAAELDDSRGFGKSAVSHRLRNYSNPPAHFAAPPVGASEPPGKPISGSFAGATLVLSHQLDRRTPASPSVCEPAAERLRNM